MTEFRTDRGAARKRDGDPWSDQARGWSIPSEGLTLMRAAWWWIDQWRQSTAYTDMHAEEQGLYRNLLDELWLRPGHVIPDDPRILARASGDPDAWARVGKKVLRWMRRVDGGWTNDTALKVIEQSEKRAEKQRRYRERLWSREHGGGNAERNPPGNVSGNSRGNAPGNNDGSQSLSLSLSKKEKTSAGHAGGGSNGLRPEDKPPDPPAKTKPKNKGGRSWLEPYDAEWMARFGAGIPIGEACSVLAPLRLKHGDEAVLPVWRWYLSTKNPEYSSPTDFAKRFFHWREKATGITRPTRAEERPFVC